MNHFLIYLIKIEQINMKEILKTIGYAALYYLVGFVVFMLLMYFFAWMAKWWWFFIIVIGIFCMSSIIGIFQFVGVLPALLSRNIVGKIFTILITARLSYLSIYTAWMSNFWTTDAKQITVKVIATIVFASLYLPMLFLVFRGNDD